MYKYRKSTLFNVLSPKTQQNAAKESSFPTRTWSFPFTLNLKSHFTKKKKKHNTPMVCLQAPNTPPPLPSNSVYDPHHLIFGPIGPFLEGPELILVMWIPR